MKKLLSAVLSLGLVLATAGVGYADWNETVNPPYIITSGDITTSGAIISTGAINTTGIMSGAVGILSKAANYTVGTGSVYEPYGYWIMVTSTATVTLPAVAVGMSVCVYSTTAAAVHVDPNGSDRIILDGTALDDGDKLTSASGAGDFICVLGESAAGWVSLGRSGVWSDGS